jgi:hypothetical protein
VRPRRNSTNDSATGKKLAGSGISLAATVTGAVAKFDLSSRYGPRRGQRIDWKASDAGSSHCVNRLGHNRALRRRAHNDEGKADAVRGIAVRGCWSEIGACGDEVVGVAT